MKKIILGSMVAASVLMADPFVSYPGTKAKGMGGAFTAVANNNSAMYFNPAGLLSFDAKTYDLFTLELGNSSVIKADDTATSGDSIIDTDVAWFIAGAWANDDDNFAGGVAAYNLYSYSLVYQGSNATDPIRVDQDVNVLAGSLAYRVAKQMYPYGGSLTVGVTGGIAFSGGGLFEYTTTDENGGTTSNFDDDTLDQRGYFFDLGVKARVLNTMRYKIDLGFNYRSKADMETVDDSEGFASAVAYNGVDLPSELAYGIAMSAYVFDGALTLAIDQKQTAYSEVDDDSDFHNIEFEDITTTNIGLDYSREAFQIRTGYYTSEGDTSGKEKVNGFTVGGGISFGQKKDGEGILQSGWTLEASYDMRTYSEYFAGEEFDENFYSLSINYVN